MLEYLLLRPAERVFTEQATSHLEYLVLDELHTYRGRQGADVAMLLRRLRERSGNPKLLNIGTSATLTTEGTAKLVTPLSPLLPARSSAPPSDRRTLLMRHCGAQFKSLPPRIKQRSDQQLKSRSP